jgi:hypothetical protein
LTTETSTKMQVLANFPDDWDAYTLPMIIEGLLEYHGGIYGILQEKLGFQ